MRNFHVSFSFGFHYNAMFMSITISNTYNKTFLVRKMKPLYMPIFMIVDASVFEFREFNRQRRSRIIMKNMATL